ncbi:MAG: YbjN domain-containing protein [Alphaproteobacteria bacterium]
MRQANLASFPIQPNPIDVAEDIVLAQDWDFERRGDDEMVAEIPGKWCDLGLLLAWSPEISALHLSCALDLKLAKTNKTQVFELLAKANEKLWLGHFSLWTEESVPIFRHSVLLDRQEKITWDFLANLIEIAVHECEKFYPAFQYVVWGGKTATDAINAVMLETVGEA